MALSKVILKVFALKGLWVGMKDKITLMLMRISIFLELIGKANKLRLDQTLPSIVLILVYSKNANLDEVKVIIEEIDF